MLLKNICFTGTDKTGKTKRQIKQIKVNKIDYRITDKDKYCRKGVFRLHEETDRYLLNLKGDALL